MSRVRSVVLVACLVVACSSSDAGPGTDGGGSIPGSLDGGDGGGPPRGDAGADGGADAGGLDAGGPDAGGPDAGPPDAGAVRYTVVDLGDLGGHAAWPFAINAGGDVVGWSDNDAGVQHAFLWRRDAGMLDLGHLGSVASYYSQAVALNDVDQVVGVAFNGANAAFLWGSEADPMQYLLGQAEATGINDHGEITGFQLVGVYTVFVRERDGVVVYMPHLGTQGGNASYANAINSAGLVAGSAQTDTSIARAILWDRATGVLELGSLAPGSNGTSLALALNDVGQAVGYSGTDAGSTHAFLWTPSDGMKDLGSLGTHSLNLSQAFGVNNLGQVVGMSHADTVNHAFLWTQQGGMVDLNGLVAPGSQTMIQAQGINDRGEIVGVSDGERALLFSPVP